MGSNVRVDWLTDIAAVERLDGPWRDLESAVVHRTHVSTFDFLYPWYRHYAGDYGGTPLIGTAWDGSALVGVAPFTLRRGRLGGVPVTRVDFAPNDSIAGEFLVREDSPEIAAAFIDSLAAQAKFDVICLNGFEPASPILAALDDLAHHAHYAMELEDHAFARVDLAPGYDAYWKGLAGDTRRKLNHRDRKIRALGATVTGVLPTHTREDAEASLARMIAINEASYKLRGQPLDRRHRAFLADIVHRFAARQMLSLPILTIGDRDAAYILGVVERGVFYDLTLSYDESFARLGPGMYLMQETLRQLADAGIHTLISHGAHEYKRTWSSAFVPQRRLFLFPPCARAAATRLVRFGLQPLWRRLREAA